MSREMMTLFSGATFHTLNDQDDAYLFLGEKKGRICYLSDARPPDGSYAREVVLGGVHVYPSLTDSHLHLMYTIAMAASGFDLCEIRDGAVHPGTVQGACERLRSHCAGRAQSDIIVANSYIASAMVEKRMPTRHELDEVTQNRRAIVYSIDGHSSSLSSSMLRALGIDPEGHDGILKGAEHEFRQGRVTEVLSSSIGVRDIARGIASLVNQCAHFGITRICALDGNGDAKRDVLTKMAALIAPRMGIDVFFYPQYMDLEKARPFWRKMRRRRIGGCGDWEMDGAVGSHSAAFYSPYVDTGQRADCYYSQEDVDRAVLRADDAGCQIATHAIGEAAIDRIVQAHEKRHGKTMHRIEHFEFPTVEAVDRVIANGNIALTVQPGFAWIDAHYLKSYESYLPQDIVNRQVPLKKLFESGVALCASSDSPVQSINPFVQMLGMTDFTIPSQALTGCQALRCYTVNPARMLEGEKQFGTLEMGKEASFFATGTDILKASPQDIAGLHATCTYMRGRKLGGRKGTIIELLGMLLRRARKI